MSTLAAAPAQTVARMRQFSWRYPEWWMLLLCASAWTAMATGAGHVHAATGYKSLPAWIGMTLAMMLPAVVPQMRRAAQGSFWHRRHRAIAGFVLGYLLPWCAVGALASVLLSLRWMHTAAAPVVLFVLAAAWQQTGIYRVARRDCHRTIPLAPFGWRADHDCARYGFLVGGACVRSCWPLMLACATTGHGLVAMAGGSILALLDAWSPRQPARTLLVGTLGLALLYAVLGAFAHDVAAPFMRM